MRTFCLSFEFEIETWYRAFRILKVHINIANGIDNVGAYVKVLAAPAGMYNPLLGGITSVVGGISPLISKTLKDVVSNAKNTKKSIERAKPQKTQDIYS